MLYIKKANGIKSKSFCEILAKLFAISSDLDRQMESVLHSVKRFCGWIVSILLIISYSEIRSLAHESSKLQLPTALPDESLFSRICRHLTLSGLNTNQYLKNLLGTERIAVHPYLTSGIEKISSHSQESADELLNNQTLASLFAHYLPQYKSIILNPSSNAQQLTRACQLSTFKEKERLKIKYCVKCVEHDIRHYGIAYWHCFHQVPGVDACYKHKLWLDHTSLAARNHVAIGFLPPLYGRTFSCTPLAAEFAEYVENRIYKLRVGTLPEPPVYDNALKDKGFLTKAGRVHRIPLAEQLYNVAEQIMYSSRSLGPETAEHYKYWSPLLAGSLNQHPIKHLILEFFLLTQAETKPISIQRASPTDGRSEKRCCELLLLGFSMAEVARQIGRSRCFVKSVALIHHIPVNLNPKKINEVTRAQVVQLAFKGFHRRAIAQRLDLSVGSVEFIISTTDGLVEWRKRCKAESMCRRYKCQIIRFIRDNPHTCRAEIKKSCEAAYFWLYHHDAEWLEIVSPSPLVPKRNCRVDWIKRDRQLSEKVTNILSGENRIRSRTELDRMLGAHSWLMSKKHKLPETMLVLSKFGLA